MAMTMPGGGPIPEDRLVPGSRRAPNFDRLAAPYRWMEYLSFGRALERCRFHFLPLLAGRRRALVLGDGDGRFTARLLAEHPAISVHAIDGSPAMLAALTRRAAHAADRLTTELADLRHWPAKEQPSSSSTAPDLIVTHFFLDCLATDEVTALALRLRRLAAEDALWIISEFAIPARGWMRPVAASLVAALYRAFGLLTGLGPQRLPAYSAALTRAGWQRIEDHPRLHGLLVSELWHSPRATEPAAHKPLESPDSDRKTPKPQFPGEMLPAGNEGYAIERDGGQRRDRTADAGLFRAALYH